MEEVNVLIRESNGLCHTATALVEVAGKSVRVYTRNVPLGMDFAPNGETDVMGWGSRDGKAIILSGETAWDVLMPLTEAQRVGLVN